MIKEKIIHLIAKIITKETAEEYCSSERIAELILDLFIENKKNSWNVQILHTECPELEWTYFSGLEEASNKGIIKYCNKLSKECNYKECPNKFL